MAELLSTQEIEQNLTQLSGWTLEGKEITIVKKFPDFIAAIDFVNRLVEPAESAAHHPDICISYNKVTISLTTHDAGGLTAKDFALAKTISAI